MLLNLHVKNLAIIDEIEVDFAQQLNVLTGETGAGKSIIIGSVNIALGGKVSKDMIRQGAEFALVELTFSIEDAALAGELEELGISLEENMLVISRKITQSRTLNRMNGESVTAAMLKKAADLLIDIHGQNEQQSLLHKAKHLAIVDRYAGKQLAGKDRELAESYQRYKKLSEELQKNRIPEEERLREISFLRYELEEIENADLKEGEEELLAEQYRRLSNAAEIVQGLSEAYGMMSRESGSVSDKLGESIRILSKISGYDERLEDFSSQLSDIDALVADFVRDVSDYMDTFEVRTDALDEVEKRLDLVRSMQAKYGTSTADIFAYADKTREKLKKYEEYDAYQEACRQELQTEEKRLRRLSEEVSAVRKKCAGVLEKEITKALIDLNFLQVKFRIAVRERAEFSAKGTDDIEFMISTNPGEQLRPVGSAASGGELSRIMLAIKAVLAGHDDIQTMIFDEIDVGISGRTAQMVAEKLALIGKEHQVICISHLAQIAAMADTPFLIEKENDREHTKTQICPLERDAAVRELARILGGAQITDAVTKSAAEMKELAEQWKKEHRTV